MISETCVFVFKNLSKYISFYCVIFLTRRAVYTYNLSFTSVFVHCTYVCIKTLMSVKIGLNFDNDIENYNPIIAVDTKLSQFRN